MTDIYTDNGYTDRAEYLDSLAEEYGMDINMVLNLAELLGPNEDFDGLVTTIQDYSARLSASSAANSTLWPGFMRR